MLFVFKLQLIEFEGRTNVRDRAWLRWTGSAAGSSGFSAGLCTEMCVYILNKRVVCHHLSSPP